MGKNLLKNILKIFITGIIILILFFIVKDFIGNVGDITTISNSVGIFGPVVFILLISLGILLTPIPAGILIIASGYLYGTWIGALYAYLGHLIAAIIAFVIFKKFRFKFGKGNEKYKKYKELIHRNKRILYLLYMFPIIPIGVISILAASLKIRWEQFLKMIGICFIPAVLFLSYFGERLSRRNLIEIGIIMVGILIIALILARFMKREEKEILEDTSKKIKK